LGPEGLAWNKRSSLFDDEGKKFFEVVTTSSRNPQILSSSAQSAKEPRLKKHYFLKILKYLIPPLPRKKMCLEFP
jgi:hypothetical protein